MKLLFRSIPSRKISVFTAGLIVSISLMSLTNDQVSDKNKSYTWQTPQAKATLTGDLQWTPRPFVFAAGKSIRYIDFESGDDNNSGKTKSAPWKHHPWDSNATGEAAKCSGIQTFVFKRGSAYRGSITIKESGEPENPIIFTSDPSWGKGEAVLYGSEKIHNGWIQGADNKDIPSPSNVWYCDLNFAPRTLWMVKGKEITRIPLARMPNWKITDPEDVKSEWWHWDYPGDKTFNVFMKNEQGKELVEGIDSKHLTGPKDLYMGAVVWSEFSWVDGTPYPSRVQGFDPEKKGIGFEGFLRNTHGQIVSKYNRYFLEDKPQFLDDPDGEFWFDKKGEGGRLYVILPNGTNPNTVDVEAGKETTLIHMEEKNHIVISGLSFKFTNVPWDFTALPWTGRYDLSKEMWPACVRVWGGGRDIKVSNCSFSYVNEAVLMKAAKPGEFIDKVVVSDCDVRETDHGGITIHEGIQYGDAMSEHGGFVYDVKVLRNYVLKAGQRSVQRIGSSNGIDVANGQTMEIAGNIIDRPWHAGLYIRCGKLDGIYRDIPLCRVLMYQNKVSDGIRTGDDCGNIETWQSGIAYVYNNVSGNPGGIRSPNMMFGKTEFDKWGQARFGMAYYLDGAFKNYYFNNIGWGLSKDPRNRDGATTMFQEIISYQNTFFNNTAYNFIRGTRRQAPQAGSDKFLGNIWDGIGEWVFWHTTPAKSRIEGNEKDAGPQRDHYALETNAFTGNIFYDITGKFSAFKPSGQWHESFEESRKALEESGAIVSDFGAVAKNSPLKNPEKRDFGLTNNSPAIDQGVKVFVPWSLFANVAEWNFYPAGNDPSRILDEHWYMTDYYYNRDNFYKYPMFHLRGVNISKENYVKGPLEDWTKGALRLDGKTQYAFCADKALRDTFSYKIPYKTDQNGKPLERKIEGRDFKSPEVYDTNFLIEAYFKTEKGVTSGILVRKMKESGYSLELNDQGGVTFSLNDGKNGAAIKSLAKINDGKWHHVIAEVNRDEKILTLYINGKKDAQGKGIASGSSLENRADLYVGGSPEGNYLSGTLDFIRICLGTLKDAKTDINELYAWEFDGPFLRDFAGRLPNGRRDAGALEK